MKFNNIKKVFNGLRFQLQFTFGSLLFLVMSVGFLFLFLNVKKIMINQIGQSRLDVLKQVAERSNTIKSNIITASNLYGYDENVVSYLNDEELSENEIGSFVKYLEVINDNYNKVFSDSGFKHDVIIIGNNGFRYSSFNNSKYDFDKLESQLWYKQNYDAEDDITFFSFAEKILNDKRYVFGAFRKIFDNSHNEVGTILISVDETVLEEIYRPIENGNNVYIFDKKGNIISSENKTLLGKNFIGVDNFRKYFGENEFHIINKLKTNYLLSNYYDEQTGWTIVEEIPFSIIFRLFNNMIMNLQLFFLVCFVVGLFFSYLQTNRIVKPIKKLCDYMFRVKDRDFEIIDDIDGYEEVIELKNSFNDMSIEIKRLLNDIKNNEKQKRKSDIDFLRAQINPHFLYNTLFSIQCMIEINKNKQANTMIVALIELLKKTLSIGTEFIPLSDEFENTKKYLILQQIRYGNKVNFELDLDEKSKNCLVPALIIQPIVENAIFHGIEAKESNGLIIVESSISESGLTITVSDDGKGLLPNELKMLKKQLIEKKSKKSIGLFNVANRIKINYGEEYGLLIDSEYGIGTTITMKLPLIYKKGEIYEDISC